MQIGETFCNLRRAGCLLKKASGRTHDEQCSFFLELESERLIIHHSSRFRETSVQGINDGNLGRDPLSRLLRQRRERNDSLLQMLTLRVLRCVVAQTIEALHEHHHSGNACP